MLGFFFALCVSLLKSLGELSGKIFTQNKSSSHHIDEYSLAFGIRFFFGVAQLPLLFFINIPPLSYSVIGSLLIVSLINALTTITALKAVKHGELSIVSPLSSFTLPFVLISSYIFLGEIPNIFGLLGVLIIFIGTYGLQLHHFKNGFFAPIQVLFSNNGARYMLLTSLLWSISAPLDKYGVLEIGVLPWLFLSNITILCALSIGLPLFGKAISLKSVTSFKNFKKIIIYAGVMGLSLVFQFLALKYILTSYVIAIKRASGMFSVVLGKIIFHEKYIMQKLMAAGLIFLGVLCIILAGNI